ncbi:MAG: metalloregulator ArsR/SmtB family transcription factor [Actinomycetota bacterium]|nr:metalloregulator ArsR/SmtB family transcription factor [Actinomycetota bacterium]
MDEKIKVKILKALADETRFEMVRALTNKREVSCMRITMKFSLSRPALSHHLRILKEAGIIRARKEGQYYYFTLDRKHVERCLPGILRAVKK